jgi:hypothetical protein
MMKCTIHKKAGVHILKTGIKMKFIATELINWYSGTPERDDTYLTLFQADEDTRVLFFLNFKDGKWSSVIDQTNVVAFTKVNFLEVKKD